MGKNYCLIMAKAKENYESNIERDKYCVTSSVFFLAAGREPIGVLSLRLSRYKSGLADSRRLTNLLTLVGRDVSIHCFLRVCPVV
jgi:hypothetical protein